MKLATEIRWQDRDFAIPLERIRQSEHWGYDAAFTAEAHGSDGLTPLGYLAAATNRIKLGTCIAQVTGRSPAVTAMAFQTIDKMAGGDRVIAGLGSSNPVSAESWHGRAWGNPVQRMRDYVSIMRQVASGDPVAHSGGEISVPYDGPGAMGTPAIGAAFDTNPNVPIIVAANGEQMVKLAGELADGWFPTGFRPGMLSHFAPWLEAGFARAGNGRSYADFDIWVHVDVNVDDDVRVAMRPFKEYVVTYLEYQTSLLAEAGMGDDAARASELRAAGRFGEAIDAIPDEFVDEGWLCGPIERVVSRLEPWLECGATGLIVRYGPQVGADRSRAPENLEVFRAVARALDKPGS